jgi:phosphatidylglycerol---prolipoprotein diacylglyceryl transferase
MSLGLWICPSFDPVFLQLGPFAIRWYGLAYVASFLWIYWQGKRDIARRVDLRGIDMDDLLFTLAMGVLLGGRIGYMVFYQWPWVSQEPWALFYIWRGGMSFHGGLLGVVVAMVIWTRKNQRNFWLIMDWLLPMVPLSLALGRAANFINGELWGRPTHAAWGLIYPWVDMQPRYPSQLIELCLEGLVLGGLLYFFSRKKRPLAMISALFMLFYAILRGVAEFFRQPDPQIGLHFGLSMGQFGSLIMFACGWYILFWALLKNKNRGDVNTEEC